MYLKKIGLVNFRNYEKVEVELGEKNVIYGKNAQGKTNFLEAIGFLALTKSFKNVFTPELLNWGKNFSRIEASLLKDNKKHQIEIYFDRDKDKRIKIDKLNKKLSIYIGFLKVVLFLPSDLNLITDSPNKKRIYFNNLLSQINNFEQENKRIKYFNSLTQFRKLILNRNRILYLIKNKKAKKEELDFWDSQIVKYGSEIFLVRKRTFLFLNKIIGVIFKNLTKEEKDLKIKYIPSLNWRKDEDISQTYKEKLKNSLKKDIEKTMTQIGPHRDNFIFMLDDKDLSSSGSRSEFRETILALKFSEIKLIEKLTNEEPIILLDDAASELDKKHQKYFFDFMDDYIKNKKGQTFITTSDLNQINKNFLKKADKFQVLNNELIKEL